MRIADAADLARAANALRGANRTIDRLLVAHAPLPLRLRPPGFAALVEIIAAQQVSTAAAAAILERLSAAGLTGALAVREAGEAALCAAGLSRPKARYLAAIARSEPDWAAMARLDDETARAALLALPGVGPWTAEVYLLSALGSADAWPAGDLALQEAARLAFTLAARPDAAALQAMAEPWRPWRAVAARALWAYYRRVKDREGAP